MSIKTIFILMDVFDVDAPLDKVNMLEDKQRKYIPEFVRNKNYVIMKSVRRNGMSPMEVNRQWDGIVNLLRKEQVQGIVVSNMRAVARDLPDAYRKIGQVVEEGGLRPPVIVSCDKSNHKFGTQVTVVPLSSKIKQNPVHIVISPEDVSWYWLN